ncbi:hypothetical protein BRADI_4g19628v3 [Brachypodium distachyon]|uniref:Embryonic stem cell-specific 5-hydroxymethylcytosine-binding protein n=1 Tax=Brachypodium distachyon TaxID=15368 RepID=A0A2K2CNR9_BRADI|nr:hypothetical protein BRADI_4g19628v3 [Brachypodium distachyon]
MREERNKSTVLLLIFLPAAAPPLSLSRCRCGPATLSLPDVAPPPPSLSSCRRSPSSQDGRSSCPHHRRAPVGYARRSCRWPRITSPLRPSELCKRILRIRVPFPHPNTGLAAALGAPTPKSQTQAAKDSVLVRGNSKSKMCGRARCTLSPAQIARAFGFPTTGAAGGGDGGGGAGAAGGGDAPAVPTLQMDRFRPSYNVSPGAYLPVGVRARTVDGDGGREGEGELEPVIQCMKWGLVPSFTSKTEKPDHFRMFNARSESIKERASFRRLVPKNRGLVAVEGFYEWKKDGSKKQPYYIHFQDQRPLVFAALFDTWKNSEGETLHTFSILTTCASTSLKWLHDRMPVILGDNNSVNAWLNNGSVKLEEITVPYEGADLVRRWMEDQSMLITGRTGKWLF